jgi:hypothetical protein
MIPNREAASAAKAPGGAPLLVPGRFVRPPRFWLLPRPRKRARGMLASMLVHCATIGALTWLPVVFPTPVVTDPTKASDLAQPLVIEPPVLRELPQLEDRGSRGGAAGPEARPARVRRDAHRVSAPANPPPQVPDFTGPQRIESYVPNPVNRVQTIQRPDLVAPPKLKFPLKLQATVSLPPATAPLLEPPAPEKPQPAPAPVAATTEEIPIPKATVEAPLVTLVPKRTSAIRSENTPVKTVAANPRLAGATKSDVLKSLVVVNAVNVVADTAPVPDAELAGSFVVGPSSDAGASEKSFTPTGRGKSTSSASLNTGDGSPSGATNGGTGTASSGAPPAPVAGHGDRSGNSSVPDSHGNGSGLQIIGRTGPGGGGSGTGAGNGASGHGVGNGNSTGISISGGVSGRTSGTVASAPLQRSYGMMVISGGNNGGASRDMGVFSRTETVYSVTIPMADAGGGPEWTMQYALLNSAEAGTGLLVPPFVEKKVGATMPKAQLVGEPGPVFVTGNIDESGKMRSLRGVRIQDARAQAAIRALEQWEFSPAQLDGKPVATKVLIGVTVSTVD